MNATTNLFIVPDNGQCVCGSHLYLYGIRGGRDSRGSRVFKITPTYNAMLTKSLGAAPQCEQCRENAQVNTLVAVAS